MGIFASNLMRHLGFLPSLLVSISKKYSSNLNPMTLDPIEDGLTFVNHGGNLLNDVNVRFYQFVWTSSVSWLLILTAPVSPFFYISKFNSPLY